MGPLTKVLTLIFFFSFMTFVTFFGRIPALQKTPIGALYRLLWIRIPRHMVAVDERVSDGRITASLSRLSNYLMYDRHPVVVIVFLIIILAGYALFLPSALPLLPSSVQLLTVVVAVSPLIFFTLSCAADPGYITASNHRYHLSLYPYDHALFFPARYCRTCNLLKPARSKHCSICKRCVAKSDHHCIFINSCVGYGNHHWFLLLLFTTALMTVYGGLLGFNLLAAQLRERYPYWTALPWNCKLTYVRWFGIWSYGLKADLPLGSTTLLATLTSPLVLGLLLYTIYQIYGGITTNESQKWTELKEDMRDGYAFRRALEANRPRDLYTEPGCERWPVDVAATIVTTEDGMPPLGDASGRWERVRRLENVENLYDLGFWDNLCDIFVTDYRFEKGEEEPMIENRRKRN